MRRLVVGTDLRALCPLRHGGDGVVGAHGQDQAALDGHDLVRPFLEKAGDDAVLSRRDGIKRLVAVALAGRSGRDRQVGQRLTAEAVQRIEDALLFNARFGLIGQVPKFAAAALLGVWTQAAYAVGRTAQYFFNFSVCGSLADVGDAHLVFLVGRGVRDKHGAAVYAAHALSIACEARDLRAVEFVFLHGVFLCFT